MAMDLRAPIGDDGDSIMSSSGSLGDEHESMPSSASLDTQTYERIIHCHLCQMHVASRSMELGSESRFTSLVLFHRYARRFRRTHRQAQRRRKRPRPDERTAAAPEPNDVQSHLGSVAAACLFLGCKMEEEPRRIRDVINLSSLLSLSSANAPNDGSKDSAVCGPSSSDVRENQLPNNRPTPGADKRPSQIVVIAEAPHPPPLDEAYWAAKERMVSIEQHVLRMIQFDTAVCHPHRCVLLTMETLGFGTAIHKTNDRNETRKTWLLSSKESEDIILRAFNMLNEVALDPGGIALHHPVMVLSCAAISLAAEGFGDGRRENEHKVTALPADWWRALDVSTNDLTMAKKDLQQVLC